MRRVSGRAIRAVLKSMGQRAWVELTLRYGKTFRHGSLVVTCEPEAVRGLLLDKAHAEVRAPLHKSMSLIPGADGILFMDGEKWVTRTRAVMPTFHRDHVDAFASHLHAIVLAHLAQWAEGKSVSDLYDAVQQIGVASVLEMGYGLDPPHPLTAALGRALVDYKGFSMAADSRRRLDEFGAGWEKLLDLPWVLTTLSGMRSRAASVRRAVRALVASGEPTPHRSGWLTQLARARLSEAELAREINHLYGAFNAVDYVVTAALCELARDRRLAESLRGELLSVLGDREPPARDDLPRLPWTNAFMLEILRRYPVSMGIVRRTGEPIELGGERLPSGTQVLILLHALHHHPDFWDEPETLKPERWIGSPSPRVAFSYVPFLDGSRKCIGRSMAEMHLLVVLSAIVRRVDVRVFSEPIVPPFMIPRFGAPIPFAVEAWSGERGSERRPSATLHPAAER
jgi:cytochrome P450